MNWVDIPSVNSGPPYAMMHPSWYRRLAVYLAFSEAWRLYGKKLGYT